MSAIKKLITGAAGAAGGGAAGLDVTDVFSAYLYDGNSSTTTVTNDIDLSTEGGLVWIKSRNSGDGHALMDTVRGGSGTGSRLNSSYTNAADSAGGTTFLTDGFQLSTSNNNQNATSKNYVSYSFRRANNFFDIVQYTGDGNPSKTFSHNLGATPELVIIKRVDAAGAWNVGYRQEVNKVYGLSSSSAGDSISYNSWVFGSSTVRSPSISGGADANVSGGTYIAYLFASHNGTGTFGPNADEDIIKIGTFTVSGGAATVNLGFVPQFVLTKNITDIGNWFIMDDMRLMANSGNDETIAPNSDSASSTGDFIKRNDTGFEITNLGGTQTFLYMAIRKGHLIPPTDATKVFEPISWAGNGGANRKIGSVKTDMLWVDDTNQGSSFGGGLHFFDRISGQDVTLKSMTTNGWGTGWGDIYLNLDHSTGFSNGSDTNWFNKSGVPYVSYIFTKARGFLDIVHYKGNGVTGRLVNHDLGVPPEVIITKRTDNSSSLGWIISWKDYLAATEWDRQGRWNQEAGIGGGGLYEPPSSHSSTQYPVSNYEDVNANNGRFVAYLFASLDGVSKCGSYTGSGGSDKYIDCGFASTARFVLLTGADTSTPWVILDTERGYATSADPAYRISSDIAASSSDNLLLTYSSGFGLPANSTYNVSNSKYVFIAIA